MGLDLGKKVFEALGSCSGGLLITFLEELISNNCLDRRLENIKGYHLAEIGEKLSVGFHAMIFQSRKLDANAQKHVFGNLLFT